MFEDLEKKNPNHFAVKQYKKSKLTAERMTKKPKAEEQWKWFQKINSIRNQSEETVKAEMIYV